MFAVIAATLLLASGTLKPAEPDRIENGRWAERAESGASGCDDRSARDIDIYYLMAPPHARSANTGNIAFALGSWSGGYILTAVPVLTGPDADGNRTLSMTGGVGHTVGVEQDGVLDAFTRGRMDAVFNVDAQGDLHLETLTLANRGRETETFVADGDVTASGEGLRGFSHCPARG